MGRLRRYELRVAERLARLDAALGRFIETCRTKPDIRAVYVFGSYATGRIGPTSDLDVLVIRETDAHVAERDLDLRREAELGVGLDLVVVRQDEFEHALSMTSFGRTILSSARLVYAT
jgi:predicted nucleotidyltransferase